MHHKGSQCIWLDIINNKTISFRLFVFTPLGSYAVEEINTWLEKQQQIDTNGEIHQENRAKALNWKKSPIYIEKMKNSKENILYETT